MMEFLDVKNLEDARKVLKEIGVSDEGISIMSKKAVHKIVKIKDLDCKAVNILKQNMLSLGGDVACSRKAVYINESRSDVLIMGTLSQFESLVKKLKLQPFGLDEISEKISNFLSRNGE